MTLHSSAARLLELLNASPPLPIGSIDIKDARANAVQGVLQIGLDPPPGVEARDETIGEGDGRFAVRLYRPADTDPSAPLPLVYFFHGGGWVLCDLESHDHLCRHIAAGVRCAVLAVDYRLAPEHPFPAAADDATEAVRWALGHAERLGIDPGKLALFGDSAGGNLAAAIGLQAGKDGLPRFALQILFYPVCDASRQSGSYERNGVGYVLPRESMEFFVDSYVDPQHREGPRASPLLAEDLSRSPPTIVYTAEYDVLHDEGVAFVEKLRRHGVRAEHREVEGHMHGFLTAGKLLPVAGETLEHSVNDLMAAFDQQGS